MSTSISSLFSSGEIKSIVTQLESRLQAPIAVEQSQIKTDQAQISALGKVQGALTSLNGALSAIADPSSINPMKATVSGSAATASAAASAPVGSYSLTNIKLAKNQEVYSGSYASPSATVGSGGPGAITFKFKNGSSATIAVPSSATTVQGVEKAINAAGKGVTAALVYTAKGVELSLQSTSPGSGDAFSVSGSGGVASLQYSSAGSSGSTFTLAQAARNASFNLNGQPITETGNSNLKVLSGLTVNLSASGSANVTVAQSGQSLSSALSSFATQFNSAIGVIAKETAYKAGKSSASASGSATQAQVGPLLGDVQVSQLQQALLSGISSAAGSSLSANALGFTISSGGQLSFDSSTFNTAYASNPTGVDNLVQSIAKAVQNVVSGAIGSTGTTSSGSATSTSQASTTGFLQSATSDFQSTVKSLNQEIAQQQTLAAAQVSLLEQQFVSAEAATNGANSTLAYIGAVLGSSKGSGG